MKRAHIILTLIASLLFTAYGSAEGRNIHVSWEYQYPSGVAGYRLYLANKPVCEIDDPTATSMDCAVDAPDGEAQFTLTTFTADGTESPASTPYMYIFSSTLKAVVTADTLQGEIPLPVTFDASSSGGTIISYEWMFGDGETGTGKIISHTFSNAGNYTVTLKVTDDIGATSQASITVVATGPSTVNTPPKAAISSSSTVGDAPLQVQFDGTGSTDSDGTILAYTWEMGDGGTATGSKVTYTYSTAGTYNATLTVTDDGGLTDSISTPVIVTTPPKGTKNKNPVAMIHSSTYRGPAPYMVHLNAQGSYDPDGSIKNYTWNFGDGTRGSGFAATHIYSVPGIYVISLQVTDNLGARSSLVTFSFRALGKNDKLVPALPPILQLLLGYSEN